MSGNYVAAPIDGGDFVELARSQKGRLFKKQVLHMGESFVHPANPGKTIEVNKALAESLVKNFKAGVCDIVQVPLANDANQHVEDPTRNIGEVVDITYDDKGVYTIIDARKHAEDLGSTLLGASALMHMNYVDTKTGQAMGPTLLHTAITNRPYITNLSDFEEVIAASTGGMAGAADTSGEAPVVLVPATNSEEDMDLDQMLTKLKDDHGIDVRALQEAQGEELLTALSNVLAPEAEETLSINDVAAAVIELHEERVALSSTVEGLQATNEALAQKEAEAEVDGLIKQGRVLPKQREKMIHLSRTDRETFEAILPEDSIVALSATGVDTFDSPEESKAMQENIDRLAAIANGGTK